MAHDSVRVLTGEDLDAALRLSSTAGWNQRLADWRMLLALAPRGGFAAFDVDQGNRLVGTAIGIDYGGFGWIAMMLVDPAWRGRGLGRRLLEAAIDAIPAGRPIRLDATPMGRPLYQSYGFEDEARLNRHVAAAPDRTAAVGAAAQTRALVHADLRAIDGHDSALFGGNRRAVLEWALDAAPDYARVHASRDGCPQYCLGRQGRLFDQIGPVVAADDETAVALVTAALPAAGDRPIAPVAIDAFDGHNRFTAWLNDRGFRIERPLYRMCRPGHANEAWTPRSGESGLTEFAIFGPEFG